MLSWSDPLPGVTSYPTLPVLPGLQGTGKQAGILLHYSSEDLPVMSQHQHSDWSITGGSELDDAGGTVSKRSLPVSRFGVRLDR